jgi:hypothetical protein
VGEDDMDKELIVKLAAEAAVNAAMNYLSQQNQKEKKSRHDKRLRNTKLLLKHYPLLNEHCKESVFNLPKAITTERVVDVLDSLERYSSDIYIESIKKSVTRAYIILAHIEQMLKLYKIYCETSGKAEDERRYRIIQAVYFDGVKIASICESEGIDESTYYRDIREACGKLSALIFGIDGIS